MAKQASSVAEQASLSIALWPLRFTGIIALVALILFVIAMTVQVGWTVTHADNPQEEMEQRLVRAYDEVGNQQLALRVADLLFQPLWRWTHLQQFVTAPPEPTKQGAMSALHASLNVVRPYLVTAMYATKLIGVRLTVVITAASLIILLMLVAGVDGLVQRQIRIYEIARESGSRYRLGKWAQIGFVPSVATIYCSWPSGIEAAYLIGPIAIVAIGGTWLRAKWFKKYV